MRDYDNMPVLNWSENRAAEKASAQILHQEPVILQMPDDFNTALDDNAYNCHQHNTGVIYNCDGHRILQQLATQNNLPELNTIARACLQSSSLVDIDGQHHRIIVHD